VADARLCLAQIAVARGEEKNAAAALAAASATSMIVRVRDARIVETWLAVRRGDGANAWPELVRDFPDVKPEQVRSSDRARRIRHDPRGPRRPFRSAATACSSASATTCAVLRGDDVDDLLLTTDLLLEGRHFRADRRAARTSAGRRSRCRSPTSPRWADVRRTPVLVVALARGAYGAFADEDDARLLDCAERFGGRSSAATPTPRTGRSSCA